MWPLTIDWQALRFGVEIEFVGGDPNAVAVLPGWNMALNEHQIDERGEGSGAELQSPPLRWEDREQIREMLNRLRATGAEANWSCGLHVHVGLEAWGQSMVVPLLDAAVASQEALQALFQTAEDRLIYCPPVLPEMKPEFLANPVRDSLVRKLRPQSHRCGMNVGAWFDNGTVEIRYANASLDYAEVERTVELCLRYVAAVGAGTHLPGEPVALAEVLGAPTNGYPAPAPAPLWHRERVWLEEALVPVLTPLVETAVPEGEILQIRPTAKGLIVTVETPDQSLARFLARPALDGWTLERQ